MQSHARRAKRDRDRPGRLRGRAVVPHPSRRNDPCCRGRRLHARARRGARERRRARDRWRRGRPGPSTHRRRRIERLQAPHPTRRDSRECPRSTLSARHPANGLVLTCAAQRPPSTGRDRSYAARRHGAKIVPLGCARCSTLLGSSLRGNLMLMEGALIDTMILSYLAEAMAGDYDPKRDPDSALREERVAAFRLFLWCRVGVGTTAVEQAMRTLDAGQRTRLERL